MIAVFHPNKNGFPMKIVTLFLAALFAATAFAQDKAATPPMPSPGAKEVVVGEVSKVSATVTAIDPAARAVTLKLANGSTTRYVAGPEMKNFAQVQVGDLVTLEYVQALAVTLKKSTSQVRERVVTEVSSRAPQGQKPGGLVMRDINVIATVQAIDTKNNTITLRGPERQATLKVQDAATLKGIKVGENVEVEYTEAATLKVEKPAAAAAPAASAPAAAKPAAPAAPAAPAKK
jgi:Cu/Ag efflux protein CusF